MAAIGQLNQNSIIVQRCSTLLDEHQLRSQTIICTTQNTNGDAGILEGTWFTLGTRLLQPELFVCPVPAHDSNSLQGRLKQRIETSLPEKQALEKAEISHSV
jgi:hypothetical protein